MLERRRGGKALIRHRIPQHFTASGVVIRHGHILLVHHKRIGAWLPPGGHIEEFEMPHEAAVREVFEETGVAVEVIAEPVPETGDADAFFLRSPLCLHGVRAVERGQDFYHLDLAYLCCPADQIPLLPPVTTSPEVVEARWIKLSELTKWPLAKNVAETVELARVRLIQLGPEP